MAKILLNIIVQNYGMICSQLVISRLMLIVRKILIFTCQKSIVFTISRKYWKNTSFLSMNMMMMNLFTTDCPLIFLLIFLLLFLDTMKHLVKHFCDSFVSCCFSFFFLGSHQIWGIPPSLPPPFSKFLPLDNVHWGCDWVPRTRN